ncbi:hypothetical protein HOY80DRAFT_1133180 [Tuber brumale]|nr:hypothetical protein HOY80DRAFT_1141394 [Tuber brumale]KAG0644281.1 hypothetical protein HOY80DRAFT_1133180 [Tuber brumale]
MLCRSGSLSVLRLFLLRLRALSHPRPTLARTPPAPMGASARQWTRLIKDYGPTDKAHDLIQECSVISERLRTIEIDNMMLTLALANEKSERLRLVEIFNIRGAIEHIVFKANWKLEKGRKIPVGIQSGIDEMAKQEDFQDALAEVVKKTSDLVLEDVKSCVPHVYHKLSKHAHGNNGCIIIRHGDHTVNEVAALATIFRTQEELGNGIPWREEQPTAKGE